MLLLLLLCLWRPPHYTRSSLALALCCPQLLQSLQTRLKANKRPRGAQTSGQESARTLATASRSTPPCTAVSDAPMPSADHAGRQATASTAHLHHPPHAPNAPAMRHDRQRDPVLPEARPERPGLPSLDSPGGPRSRHPRRRFVPPARGAAAAALRRGAAPGRTAGSGRGRRPAPEPVGRNAHGTTQRCPVLHNVDHLWNTFYAGGTGESCCAHAPPQAENKTCAARCR